MYSGEEAIVNIKTKQRGIDRAENQAENQAEAQSNDGRWMIGICVFLLIVLVGIAGRFWLVDMPNFKPVAALILFGGFFFRRSWPAILALLLIMVFSDLKLGAYHWALTACVYTSLGLSCYLGSWVKQKSLSSAGLSPGAKSGFPTVNLQVAGRFVAASLAMSTLFFLLTNVAVWLMGQWYPGTWTGLIECFVAGLPFYKATMVGDLMFTGVIVGSYSVVQVVVGRVANRSRSVQGLEVV